MTEIQDLALIGLDLVPKALDHLAPKLTQEDQALLKDIMDLQYKAVQVSTGLKVHPDTLQSLIDKIVIRICSI